MCLAKAYLYGEEGPFVEEVAYAKTEGGYVHLETLLGEEKTIMGQVVSIDFTASKLFISPAQPKD